MVIDCLKLRDQVASEIKSKVDKLKSREITPSFAIIQIGDNPNSNVYIRVKTKKAEELGIKTEIYKFLQTNTLPVIPAPFSNGVNSSRILKNKIQDSSLRWNDKVRKIEKKVEKLINQLNLDRPIHGIIIQRPLPVNFDENRLQSLIDLKKDIDGLSKNSPFKNPLVSAVEHVIHYVFSQSNFPLPSADCKLQTVVVGKGITAGAPIYRYFANHPSFVIPAKAGILYNFRVSQIDSSTKNPDEILKKANIIISCVGKERIIRQDNIKKGVILISVGQHQSKISNFKFQISNSGRWAGDYNEEEIATVAAAYTPTPNGIGPLNVIFLLQNVINAIE